MRRLEHLLRWCIEHWKNWGVTTLIASAAVAGTWILARRREWTEARKVKAQKTVDSRVIRALEDRGLWTGIRGITGGGDPLVRSRELAEKLSLDCEVVIESLDRLETRGRVRNAGGTLDDPAPHWHVLRR
jgi:hypothetical protein